MIGRKLRESTDRTFYPHYGDRWDDLILRKEVESLIDPRYHLLDLGAGTGNNSYMNFRGKVTRVVGVDPDTSVLQNPFLDDAKIGKGKFIPCDDAVFDVAIAANVLEHLDDPGSVFREVYRVLKPGGVFIIKTPNKYHYVTLVSRLTPISFHRFYNKSRGINQENIFLTKYKANDPQKLHHLSQQSGFEIISIDLFEGRPEYLRIFWPMYLFGLLYERVVNHFEQLNIFKGVIIAKFRKPR